MASIYREVTKFSVVSGAEQAVIGWHWDSAASVSDIADAINAHFPALWTAWKPNQVTDLAVTERELQEKDIATGAIISITPLTLPSPAAGTAEQFPLPPQCCAVMSLRTAATGPKGRGRFYLSGLGNTMITANGRLTTTVRNSLVDSFKTYVDAVQGEILDLHLSVYSKAHGDGNDVLKLDMGDVVDTQRRRRNDLVEARYTVTL